jgi:hypothetical protein
MSLPEIKAPQSDPQKAARTVARRIGWFTRAKGEQIRECVVWDASWSMSLTRFQIRHAAIVA